MPNNADIHVSFFQTISVTESEVAGIQAKSAMGITFQVNGSENVVKQTHFTMQIHSVIQN